jgi:hypothetical protein
MSCILVYYDLFFFCALLPLLLYARGIGLYGRFELVTLMISGLYLYFPNLQYLSTIAPWVSCLDFRICLLSGPHHNGPPFLLSEPFWLGTHGTKPCQ